MKIFNLFPCVSNFTVDAIISVSNTVIGTTSFLSEMNANPPMSLSSYYSLILILCYGICLQLLRLWTRSLWTAIGFHLAYLEITRFAVTQNDGPSIISYTETEFGLGELFISFGLIVIGGIIVSLFIWHKTFETEKRVNPNSFAFIFYLGHCSTICI